MANAPAPWAPTADRLSTAVKRLVAAAQPSRIILFGSHARGDADDHSDVDDRTLGFHAQQAAEKLVKAALVARKADYPRTHNLGVLIELLSDAGVKLPADLADIDRHRVSV